MAERSVQRVRLFSRALAFLGFTLCAACVHTSHRAAPVEPQDATVEAAQLSTASVCVHADADEDGAERRADHLDCLNQVFAKLADQAHRLDVTVDATRRNRPEVAVGAASEVAVRQRLGNAFGVSVHPQRP